MGAEWDCFDLTAGLFDVRQNLVRHEGRWLLHDTKTHERRTVPLPQRVVGALRVQRARQAEQRLTAGAAWQQPAVYDVRLKRERIADLAFTSPRGAAVSRQTLYKSLQRLCQQADVQPLAPPDLRRAANTLLVACGVDPAVIRQLAGHLSDEMTDLYTTRLDSHMRHAVEELAAQLS